MTGSRASLRNTLSLARARLKPRCPASGSDPLATTWNRIGGLFCQLERVCGLEPAAAAAVWMVECGGLPFRRGKPVLRLEAHVLFNQWGKQSETRFDDHFRFGGRNGVPGEKWQHHQFRPSVTADWSKYHGDQDKEHMAFSLAKHLAGMEAACRSASFGGPQIMGFNHQVIGYSSAAAMFESFARSERNQVFGFFDFCAAKELIPAMRSLDWLRFASVYNGPGNADAYAARIAAAYHRATAMLVGLR